MYLEQNLPRSLSSIIKAEAWSAAVVPLPVDRPAAAVFVKVPGEAAACASQHTRRDALQLLAKARREAGELLAAARIEAEALKNAAHQDGYQEGMAAGQQQGRHEGMAEGMALGWRSGLERAQETIRTAQEVLRVAGQVKEKALAYMERDVLDMIIAIGEKLARREIQRDDNFIISFITAMLREANDTSHLTIRIPAGEGGPSAEQVAEILQDLAENLRVVVDKNLEPGDCVVENEAGVFDGRIRTRLDCIRSSLEMVANGDKPD